ncbi:hypothetical protein HYT92_02205 [Candidatus Pacearchaeota archaeon]|nr:hypothetical protein [Candidatus Pacearchaeota archaeon]
MNDVKSDALELEKRVVIPLTPLNQDDLGLVIGDITKAREEKSFEKAPLNHEDLSVLLNGTFGTFQPTDREGKPKGDPRELVPSASGYSAQSPLHVLVVGEIPYKGAVYSGIFRYDPSRNAPGNAHLELIRPLSAASLQRLQQRIGDMLTFKPGKNSTSLLVYVSEAQKKATKVAIDGARKNVIVDSYDKHLLELGHRFYALSLRAYMRDIAAAMRYIPEEDVRENIARSLELPADLLVRNVIPFAYISMGYRHEGRLG